MMRQYTAVLDRFEEDTAVLLVEADGEVVDELLVDRWELPKPGREQGAIFDLRVFGDSLRVLSYRPAETEARSDAAQSRFDRLAQDLPTTDDASSEEDGSGAESTGPE
ncbi:DUF3006 domain-containing protein [Haloarchaeobius litoreus]|uniref:DUF3006 domain-containing protein n=1 Tax=Haloarchaeobius litoreus TaxID=755306 RepID=A0ABD6DCL3_9EURY|nr:DUF3006 domain-containing protein [Haloarchaeobius litoreus]